MFKSVMVDSISMSNSNKVIARGITLFAYMENTFGWYVVQLL